MKFRKLGNSGLTVSTLALGGNVFGWTADEPNFGRDAAHVRVTKRFERL
ncbi:MAG: hypothetical protein WBX50_06170 [Candidatus Deferrimicrobiaceae bacterium]